MPDNLAWQVAEKSRAAQTLAPGYLMQFARRVGYRGADLPRPEALEWLFGHGLTWPDYFLRLRYAVRLRRMLLRAAGLRTGWHVLEVGFGLGDATLAAADLVGPGGHVTAVDVAPDVLDWSILPYAVPACAFSDRTTLWPGVDVLERAFPLDTFDAVVFCFSANHLGRVNIFPQALQRCSRWCRRVAVIDRLPRTGRSSERLLLEVVALRNEVFDLAQYARLSQVVYRSAEAHAAILDACGFTPVAQRVFQHPADDIMARHAALGLMEGIPQAIDSLGDTSAMHEFRSRLKRLRRRAEIEDCHFPDILVMTGVRQESERANMHRTRKSRALVRVVAARPRPPPP